ncbi:MAG: hypothetical protein K2N38_12050 [Oscillospiraceae bacterium]|nr:hypothetical protein [Oscillospiraceae bacterium]
MKAKQLFLLINEIDDKLISDAEGDGEQPVEVVMERRFPLREILACAACAAVLVIGVFAVAKVRGIETPPDSGVISSPNEQNSGIVAPGNPNASESSGTPPLAADRIDGDFPNIVQPIMGVGTFEDTLRGIMLRAKTVEQLESDIKAADTDGRVLDIKVTKKTDKVEYYKTGEPVTEGAIENDMLISVTFDAENHGLRYLVGYAIDYYYGEILNEGGTDYETSPVRVKDKEFPNIVQPFMDYGSFEDTIRGIMLRAKTVEQLESDIKAADTDGRVTYVKVTENYRSTEDFVTEGTIEDGMFIRVTYTDEGDGLIYYVGHAIDFYAGDILFSQNFVNGLMNIIDDAETIDELYRLIRELDVNERVTAVNVYNGTETVTEGMFMDGMTVRIEYDNGSYLDGAKSQERSDYINFVNGLMNIVDEAKTIEELNRLIKEYDVNERVTSVNVYDGTEPVTKGEFINGMYAHIEYDNGAYMESVKTNNEGTGAEASSPRVFPPEEKTAPVNLPGIGYGNAFELDGIGYYEFPASSYFVIDGGEIVQAPYDDSVSGTSVADKLPDAIGKLFSLEYLGALSSGEYLFRYDGYILAVMNAPDSMKHDVFFKDSGYDESQFYAAYFYVPYDA